MPHLALRNALAGLGAAAGLVLLTAGAVMGMRYVSEWPIGPAVAVSMVVVAGLVAAVRYGLGLLDDWLDRADAGPRRDGLQ
jgi:hypothetical protein